MSTQIKDKYHTLLEDAIRNQEMFIVKEPKSVPGSPNVVVTPQIFPSPDAPVIRAVTRRASLFSIKHTTSQDSISLKTEVMAVTKMLLEKARAERCCVILAEDNEIKLGFKYSLVAEVKTGQMHPLQRNIPLANCEKELSMSIVNRVIDTQQATLTNNVREARLLLIQDQYLGDKGVNAVLCSPILLNGQLHGMLYFESCSEKAVFSEQQKEMVSAIIDATVQNSKLHKQMKQVNSTYEHFMPKEFLKYLNKSGSQNDFKESISRDMAICTADFKSILSLTENRNASDTFAFMNQFLTKITPHVIGNNGLVHRFVHDALICLYPETVDDALKSCVEMVNALRDTSTDRKVVSSSAAYANNDFRIGLHHGKVKLGTLALSEERLDLTVLSDSLQQTKTLQRLAKKFNVSILATNNIIDRITSYRDYKIGETTVHYCRLGKFCIRETNATNAAASSGGTHTSSTTSVLSTSAKPTPNSRGETYELYEVYDPKWNTYLYSDERKKEFLKGVSFFQHRKFIAAMNIFAKLYKLNEHDQTSRFYMRVCKMYQQIDLPSNWDGVVLIDGNCEPNPISSKSNSFYLQTGITAFFHLGDEQVLSSGRDKEEEIRLLNDSLSEKAVTIKDMKAILNVKEQEIARLNEITELLIKEKKQEVEKVKHNLDKEKKKNEALEKRLGIDSSKKGGSGKKSDSNCFTWLSSSPPQPSVGKNKVVPVNPNGNNNRIGKYK
jgi:class 3 adenylate cyclase